MYPAKELYKDKIAQNYDKERFGNLKGRIYSFFEIFSIERALRKLPFLLSIVDVPCGTGRITKYLYDRGHIVTGVDISQNMIEIARQKVNARFRVGDIESLETGYFECSVCVRFMGHLPYEIKVKALKELKRISEHIIVTFYMKKHRKFRNIRNVWYPLTTKELKQLLTECNLRVKGKFPVFPFWSDGVTYLLEDNYDSKTQLA